MPPACPCPCDCDAPRLLTAPAASLPAPQVASRLSLPRYYGALCLLTDTAGFLIEPKAASMIGALAHDEAGQVAASAIVRALGVTDGPGVEALMEALTADSGEGQGRGQEKRGARLRVPDAYVHAPGWVCVAGRQPCRWSTR